MDEHLLAMSEFTANMLYPLAGLYAILAAYLVLGGWRLRDGRQRIGLIWFLLLPIATFIALWFCGRLLWIVFWWLQLGDDGPYERYSKWTSAFVALFLSTLIFARLATGLASRRYLLISFLGSIILVTTIGTLAALEFANRIYGWSARSAAESYLSKFSMKGHPFIDPTAPRSIVKEAVPTDDPTQVRTFVLCYGKARIQQVRVVPYGWWWWTFASSTPLCPGEHVFIWAQRNWDLDRDEATRRLTAVVRDYPNTEASKRAEGLLRSLRASETEISR